MTFSTSWEDGTGQEVDAAYLNSLDSFLNSISEIDGIVKGTGSGVAAAVSGTDYMRAHWVNVLDYGADPTGVNDSTAAFTSAFAALPDVGGTITIPTGGGVVYAPTGNYKISSTISLHEIQSLWGDGINLTNLVYTGTGACISAALAGNDGVPTGWPTPCVFEGFTIDGTNAASGAIGLQSTNLFHTRGDIRIQNFNTTDAIGLYFKNTGSTPVADRMQWRVSLRNNTTGVVFDGGGTSGTSSNAKAFYWFEVVANTNQNVCTLQNNAVVEQCEFAIVGNCVSTSATNTGWVIGIDVGEPSNVSSLRDCHFLVALEMDGSPGDLGHTSIIADSTVGTAEMTGTGILSFMAGYTDGEPINFQGASIATGFSFGVSGRINDPTLGMMTYGDCENFQGGTQRNSFVYTATYLANNASGVTIQPQSGDVQRFLLPNTDVVIAGFLNAPYTTSRSLELFFQQPASGTACAVSWPTNIQWANGKDTLSTVNGAVDKVRMTYSPSATMWYAELLTNFINTGQIASNEYIGNTSSTVSATNVPVPPGITGALITIIGPGGGGASGRTATGTGAVYGGGGGGGGAIIKDLFLPADAFGTTYDVSIPAAGLGGAPQSTATSGGNSGGTPSSGTQFSTGSVALMAAPGGGGLGNATGTAGAAGTFGTILGSVGGTGGAGAAGSSGGESMQGAPGGGGGGGGISSGPTAYNGGVGGNIPIFALVGGVAGTTTGTSPGAGTGPTSAVPGAGAGGGASSITGNGQAGASASGYGAGGGGGGTCVNGNSSGAGGNGGLGYIGINWLFS